MRLFRFMPLILALALTQGLQAQQEEADAETDETVAEEETVMEDEAVMEEEAMDEIVVTGSRIRRDEFTSAAPVQIIDGQVSRELGLIDTAALLQSATQATGTQVDSSFTSFVVDNGPGAAQINLRGLGAQRVLLLLNSRRVAPGGVGGAPTSPDLSTIPSVMIDRIEFLLDGASSIYGSDAVAGVANVIMRKDFEGFEFEGELVETQDGGGGEKTFGIAWGKTADNWTLGLAAEVYDRQRLRWSDRPFTEHCNRYLYEDESGNPLSIMRGLVPGTTDSPCKLQTMNRVFIPVGFGNVWYTPGSTNIGIPNFSETEVPVGFTRFNPGAIVPIDTDGDGVPDTGLVDPDRNGVSEIDLQTDAYNFNGSDRNRAGDFRPNQRRVNLYAYGEHDLGNASNSQAYFEFLYANRKTEVFSPGASIFPDVPANNPYNPCNQFQPNGVNCLGFFGFNFGNFEVTPIVHIRGDRDNNDVEIEQFRWVAGLRGDLPGWRNDSGFGNWGYDFYFSHSSSQGTDFQTGILERELTLSLETSVMNPATGEVTCGNGQPCVPVNMFADSIYQPGGGDFATPEERDFVFGVRSFDTKIYQSIFSGVLQGDVATLPWNNTSIPLVLGVEYREDEINSIPNQVASEGLLIAFFRDGGAVGKRDITELFFESEFQLLEGVTLAQDLSLNLAMRWTRESTYGSDTTYSAKSAYTPFTGITFRGTYGTSFRAPNTHEQFLAGTSGFATIFDPCVVPVSARDASLNPNEPATYNPDEDLRDQTTLDNCRANGVDPTTLGLDGFNTVYSVERLRKGGQQVQLDIDPETSTSYTYGIVLDQPFWDTFTLRAGVTYYDVDVENTISQLGTGFIINDCYVEQAGNSSAFCRFINRGPNGLIDLVEASFVNINAITSRGIDYNLYFQRDFVVFDRNLNLQFDFRVTRLLENNFIFRESEEDDAATPVAPEWEGTALVFASYGDFRMNWRANYINDEEDEYADFDEYAPCYGLGVLCRPIARTGSYWTHTASITWVPRDWEITLGVVNVFDEDPPLMDTAAPEVQVNNVPLGAG
ncbi:MAG: TonB-dependent receptor [Gammaproteobacteria bacterium]|nr:TonB-dependent receptor [Gammaproteobacteria bacterium]